jgi:radical SAM superfamily enzyme YgiQ (UPF0313 family)
MKIVLVQCPAWGRQNPPLALSMLSAYLRSKGKEAYLFDLNNALFHKVKNEDRELWQLGNEAFWENKPSVLKFATEYNELFEYFVKEILETGADIVGFSIFNSSKELSLLMASRIKEIDKNKKIIFGGPHCAPHIQGKEVIKEGAVDMMVIGEGEQALDELVGIIERDGKVDFCSGVWLRREGDIIDCGDRALIKDLNVLPFADFRDFKLESYDEPYRLPIYLSRGCPNSCVYCNENSFWRGYRSRSGARVFKEIKYQLNKQMGVMHFDFCDSLVNANIRELSHLAELIISEGLKITWGGQAIVRPYMTPEVLSKLKQSGCVCLAYGIESGSTKVLNLMRKGFKVEEAERVIKDTHNAGIDTVANFMFGFPGETDEDFAQTLDFVAKNKEYIKTINPSLAYTAIGVGTYLYNHPEEYNIDLNAGYLYWKSKDGENTYEKRQKRYETFCKSVLSLGINTSYPINIQ